MSFCNKSAAQALKEAGFDRPTVSRWKDGINGLYHDNVPRNHNKFEKEYSAPTHLDAADFLAEKHGIAFDFGSFSTSVFIEEGKEPLYFTGPDHRNDAIISACKRVKGK